jgi:hypothetical protein
MAAKQSSEGPDDEVIDFYDSAFGRIFSVPFRAQIAGRLKAKAVIRQVEESADAASHSLIRLFQNLRLDSRVVTDILVDPVMAEWRRLSFASTFEMPRRVVNRLNRISAQSDALGQVGQETAARVADRGTRPGDG